MVVDRLPAKVRGELGSNLILGERSVHLAIDEADPLLAILSRAHLNVPRRAHKAVKKVGVGDVFHTHTIADYAYESKRKAL